MPLCVRVLEKPTPWSQDYSGSTGRFFSATTPAKMAMTASANDIRTLYPASDRPRKRHAASSQRTTRVDCICSSRLLPPVKDQGKVSIGVPIDMPFTELNRLLELKLKGKTFPEDGSGPAEVTVSKSNMAASGDRLLISMRVKAKEKKSWFGLGADRHWNSICRSLP